MSSLPISPRFAAGRSALLGRLPCLAGPLAKPLHADESAEAGRVADGRKLSIECALSLGGREEFQTHFGEGPLIYEHGANQVIPRLDEAVAAKNLAFGFKIPNVTIPNVQ